MKKYNSRFYDDVDKALEDCNNHQDWNVINIYRTGWREEVGVVYYIRTDALKQEWSEEDKDAIDQAILALEDLYDGDCPLCRYDGYKLPYDKAAKRLKSLKDRYTWKPSLAQLNALSVVAKGNAPDDIEEIKSLLNDLKKLTE